MGWINEAQRQGELKTAEHNNCPFCNPERRTDVPTTINACKHHKWVSKKWFKKKFKKSEYRVINLVVRTRIVQI